jgi:hypothetical protein
LNGTAWQYNPEDSEIIGGRTLRKRLPNLHEYAFSAQVIEEKAALEGTERVQWLKAQEEELESMRTCQVWTNEGETPPPGTKSIGTRWVFTKKFGSDGKVSKFKARLVARGFNEKKGIDYDNIFAPVAKVKSIRCICALAVQAGHVLYQDDIKTAFLNAPLDIRKWIRLPNGNHAFLQKAIYGLKEAPRMWYLTIRKFMYEHGFKTIPEDECIFTKGDGNEQLIVCIYVDDFLTTGKLKNVETFRQQLKTSFQLSQDGGMATWYLGMNI